MDSLDMYISFVLMVCVICLCLFLLQRNRHRSPGPLSLPFIGALPQIGVAPHKTFECMRKTYGDVFHLKIGSQPMFIFSGFSVIKETMGNKGDLFAGRPHMYTSSFLSDGKSLSFTSNNTEWKFHRRAAERSLRILADGSSFLNSVVTSEARLFAEQMLSKNNVPQDPCEALLWSVAHIKYTMCYGNSRTEDTNRFETVIKGVLEVVNTASMLNFFPIVRQVAWWRCRRYENVCNEVCGLVKQHEVAHQRSFTPGTTRDVLDALIQVARSEKHEIDTQRVLHTSQDFLGAGIDIMHMSLYWSMLYLAQYPSVQSQIRMEVSQVVPLGSTPRKEDLWALPYTQAFVCEVLRHSSVVPFSLPHSNVQGTVVNGVKLPKDSFILTSLYSVHHDTKIWGDPQNFRPERFLSCDGGLDKSMLERFMPCGVGKRKCVGENLAKQEIALYVTTLLQQCQISRPDDVINYDLEGVFDICLKPKPYKVVFSQIPKISEP